MVRNQPPEIDDFAVALTAARKAVEETENLIRIIDSTLERIDSLMYVMQPFQYGRIGIKRVFSNGRLRWQVRIFRQLRSRKWVSSFASHKGLRRRVKRSREWEANYKFLQLLCDRVTLLFELRSQAVDRLWRFSHGSTRSTRAREAAISDTVALVDGLLERIEARFEGDMELEDE